MSKFRVAIESTQLWVYVYEVEADSLEAAEKKGVSQFEMGTDSVDNWVESESFVVGSVMPVDWVAK